MRTCEPELAQLLRQRQLTFETRIDSWLGTELLAANIPHRPGATITEDATSNVGGTLTFEVPASTRWSPELDRSTHPLGDVGQRLHVTRYLVTADQQRHPIVMGWWRIIESPLDEGSVKVKAAELWDVTSEYEMTYPLTPSLTSHWRALEDALAGTIALPATIPATITDFAFPEQTYDEDRVAAVVDILEDLGAVARIDQCGLLDLQPDPYEVVVASFADGRDGTLVDKVPTVGPGAANAYVVRTVPDGEEPPIQAIALLTAGPQRWDGPYGNRPEFYSSPLLKTYGQCRSAAQRLLARSQARQTTVAVKCAPDPRLQVNDLVSIDWTSDASSSLARDLVRIDTITHPLSADSMDFTGAIVTAGGA